MRLQSTGLVRFRWGV